MDVELSKHVGFKIWFLGRVVTQGVHVAATLPISLRILSQFQQVSTQAQANQVDSTLGLIPLGKGQHSG